MNFKWKLLSRWNSIVLHSPKTVWRCENYYATQYCEVFQFRQPNFSRRRSNLKRNFEVVFLQNHVVVVKVSKFQNEFMKPSFLPKYEQKNIRISALTTPSLQVAEILTIFCSYFGRNDGFINSFWNLLTFSSAQVLDQVLYEITFGFQFSSDFTKWLLVYLKQSYLVSNFFFEQNYVIKSSNWCVNIEFSCVTS